MVTFPATDRTITIALLHNRDTRVHVQMICQGSLEYKVDLQRLKHAIHSQHTNNYVLTHPSL